MATALTSFLQVFGQRRRKAVGLLIILLGLQASAAHAVFILLPVQSPRTLILQVGSNSAGLVNRVDFNVSNDKVSPNNTPITGQPTVTTGSVANSVMFRMTVFTPFVTTGASLTSNSPTALSCVAGSGCGSTVIPMNSISWVSYQKDTTYPGLDIQDGTFNGGSQTLVSITLTNTSVEMTNSLVFTYNNSTLYPAGRYSGRVVYTASVP